MTLKNLMRRMHIMSKSKKSSSKKKNHKLLKKIGIFLINVIEAFTKVIDKIIITPISKLMLLIMDLFKKKSSGNVAKDRLKLVLVSDRANCSSEMMEMMKRDIIEVISRYMDIDAEALDVKITETESDSNNGMVPALVANIPIRDMKHRPDPR